MKPGRGLLWRRKVRRKFRSVFGKALNTTDTTGDDAAAELVDPPEDLIMTTSATALEPNPEDAKPIPTLDSSSRLPRLTSFTDALPPKPSSGTAPATSLLYSAQVAEQFSSSYHQTLRQDRGRLQFNNGAPSSASTGAGSTGGQVRPVRPSEMKDEGCVFSLSLDSYSMMLLYVMGGVPSYLAVVSTRTRSRVTTLLRCVLPDR